MPIKTKRPRDYSKGKIYKIICLTDPSVVYYGSTTQDKLADRMKQHRDDYRWYLQKGKIKCYSSRVLEKGKSIILLVEPWPCTSKDELCMREGKWILENECVNKHVAGAIAMYGGEKEYRRKKEQERYASKTEQCNKATMAWHYKNRTKVVAKMNIRGKQKKVCSICGSEVSYRNMATHKKTAQKCLKIQQEVNLTQ